MRTLEFSHEFGSCVEGKRLPRSSTEVMISNRCACGEKALVHYSAYLTPAKVLKWSMKADRSLSNWTTFQLYMNTSLMLHACQSFLVNLLPDATFKPFSIAWLAICSTVELSSTRESTFAVKSRSYVWPPSGSSEPISYNFSSSLLGIK